MAKKKIEKNIWRNLQKTANTLKNILDNNAYLVFFDTETTGLKSDKDRIIQLSAIKTDKELNIIDTFNCFCNPYPVLVSPKITEITGIKQSDVENAQLETEAVKAFNDFTQDCGFFAYNSQFDYNMLMGAFERAKIDRYIQHFDVREVSYDMVPHCSNFTLSTVCEYLGIKKDGNFHNAMFDVEMTYELMKMFFEKYLNFKETESQKPSPKVYALNPWSIGKNRRVYVSTSCGTFYYDTIKKQWGEKDVSFDNVNMAELERKAIAMATAKGVTLSTLKEGISYRDL